VDEARLDAAEMVALARQREGPDGRLPVPDVVGWDIFPWEGELQPRRLRDPEPEPPRRGEDGPAGCRACEGPVDGLVWSDDRWRMTVPPEGAVPTFVLHPVEHLDLGDLDDERAADLGVVVVRAERAIAAVPGVGRVHVSRFGDGGAHLHVFLFARPAGMLQLRGSCLTDWEDILPPLPAGRWAAIARSVGQRLAAWRGEAGPGPG
jgi:hypothetical protein